MRTFIFGPNGLTDKRILSSSSREIMDIVEPLYVDGWRWSDRARLIERYDLTGKEADLIVAVLWILEE